MKRFESHPCTANNLDELLNDKWEEGWKAVHFINAGMKVTENRLMPGKQTAMPLLIVVFQRKGHVIDA